jgi:hypothetical protein
MSEISDLKFSGTSTEASPSGPPGHLPRNGPETGEGLIRKEHPVPDTALVNSDLQSALDDAREAYAARNPKSLTRHHEACEAMPGGNTRTTSSARWATWSAE